jgi:hypothetical protein
MAGGTERCHELTRDDILDNAALYWLTRTAVSSARLYWESKLAFFAPKGVDLPVAVSVFQTRSIRLRGAGRRPPIPSWSTTTGSRRAAISPPGSSRRRSPRSSGRRAGRFARGRSTRCRRSVSTRRRHGLPNCCPPAFNLGPLRSKFRTCWSATDCLTTPREAWAKRGIHRGRDPYPRNEERWSTQEAPDLRCSNSSCSRLTDMQTKLQDQWLRCGWTTRIELRSPNDANAIAELRVETTPKYVSDRTAALR